MENLYVVAGWLDSILWFIFILHVIYLLYFAWKGGVLKAWHHFETARKQRRFAVFFPAYKEDQVIIQAVESFLLQHYPQELYRIVVISDQMQPQTEAFLANLPITMLRINTENSSKAKALTFAVEQLEGVSYDVAVVMDADNTVEPDFLSRLNMAFENGIKAVQAHRCAKNLNTSTALLDAISEEINNTIFRAGHVRCGLSSALIGSGMAFEYDWFSRNIRKTSTAGEDKELELLLLQQQIYVDYLSDVPVYDEKTQREDVFGRQRRRWLAAQFGALSRGISHLPEAIRTGNLDYLDKVLQWMMLPRLLLITGIVFFGICFTVIHPLWGIKWGIALWMLGLALAMAVPDYLIRPELSRALRRIPILAINMAFNLFRLKGVNKKFIHTEHNL